VILFVMTRGHRYSVRPLVRQLLGPALPRCERTTYESLFSAQAGPAATYIFTDLERLTSFELGLAAQVYQAMVRRGLRCLNDPARVLARSELLRRLYLEGINPYNAYSADMKPRPQRFPVFVRPETEHGGEAPSLLQCQAELDRHLSQLQQNNVPLRGLLVVEYAAEPFAPGAWRRYGTFNIGGRVQMNHMAIQDRWHVSQGTRGFATEDMFKEEHATIAENRFASELRPIFELANIDWGRADHATFNGRQIVYEINTNPAIREPSPQTSPIRDEALAMARAVMAESLWAIDTGDGSVVDFCDMQELSARRAHLRRGLHIRRP
jgi:hypothetical protein